MPRFLKRFFRSKGAAQQESEKELFAARHYRFKLFLNAWNQLQEAMANMEAYLYRSRPYSMQAVQAVCTNLSAQTLQCLRRSAELSGTSDPDLERSFERVQNSISRLLQGELAPLRDRPLRLPLGHGDLSPELCDPAMIRLAAIRDARTDDCIPPACIITAAGCQMSFLHEGLQEEINRRIQAAGGMRPSNLHALCAALRDCIMQAPLPRAVEQAVFESVRYLRENTHLPRSRLLLRGRVWPGADGESGGMSLWGPVLPLEGSTDEALLHAFKRVLAKKYDPEAVIYRFNRGLPDTGTNICVGCFGVGLPQVGGVGYSRNPFDLPDTGIYLFAGDYLPETVELGGTPVDIFHADRNGGYSIRLSCPGAASNLKNPPLLTEDRVLAVAGHVRHVEEIFGAPQEVEWFFEPDGALRILHVRPLRRPAARSDVNDDRFAGDPPAPLAWGGNTGSPGTASGRACPVRNTDDARAFPEHGILLTEFDSAEWCSLLDRAAAVVAVRGTAASRLAGMCRELGIPALFGLPGILESAQKFPEITVFAETGAVYPGRIEEPPGTANRTPNRMHASPLHELLKKIAQLALPLTLVPDTPGFTAANCVTFHDIGRYCAERASEAVFRFGSDKTHSARRVKQLMAEVAKQFWVINLDDAFPEDIQGPYIPLARIDCEAMQALWQGMNAKVWEGPPPVDGRGFIAVLFESTANPHMDPASQSTFFTEKNYFLVSRRYCGLHSRFGFHFVAVDIVAGERRRENHVVFILRGGAADLARRIRRVEFAGDILREFGFSVSLRNDSLHARAENLSSPKILRLARVAGYLAIHTRQLDMIMADERQTEQRREIMLRDCRAFFERESPSGAGVA
jgi:pyruvate,water dikinase